MTQSSSQSIDGTRILPCYSSCPRQCQSDLNFSYSTCHTPRPLRSAGITPFQHYYGPLRLPIMATRQVIDSLSGLPAFSDTMMGLPGSWLICHRALSSITPDGSTDAYVRFFSVDSRLHPIRKDDRHHLCNEAEIGSLSLRLATSPLRRFHPLSHSHSHEKTGQLTQLGCPAKAGRDYMLYEQLTWLAHFSQQDQPGSAWRTKKAQEAQK